MNVGRDGCDWTRNLRGVTVNVQLEGKSEVLGSVLLVDMVVAV